MVTNVDPKHLANLKEPVIIRFEHLKVKYDKSPLLLKRIVLLNTKKKLILYQPITGIFEFVAATMKLVATFFW